MSVENFKKFGQLCAEDPKIREKVKEIGIENIDSWIAYSKNELGLEFTKEDIQTLANEVRPTDELSEEQLEQVAGGVVTTTVVGLAAVGAGIATIATVAAAGGVVLTVAAAVKRW
ncbi:hypothetical protein U14_02721 [Candidatus Moduliflexus flocculans]|uniref:Nif11 domain-containing protein n=1 Tax=Candidatus Moduliflexus flocculans TaxID=1499966 RepID=A0A081BM61_9BACT|nr:hypothetical protein U14_02721 [Candidatus Moduliflexus flocculans]